MDVPDLYSKSILQQAWHKQIKEDITNSKRPIDKMSIAEISKMYQEGKFLCDTCGKEMIDFKTTLKDHILHMINPSILWSCEDCLQSDLRNGRIIAMADESESDAWQDHNR